jgi:small-conductance mechanosensitive channel
VSISLLAAALLATAGVVTVAIGMGQTPLFKNMFKGERKGMSKK